MENYVTLIGIIITAAITLYTLRRRLWSKIISQSRNEWINDFRDEVAAYSILSSILHIKERPKDINNEPLSQDDINKGLNYINKYISDFDYSGIYKEITQNNFLKECYENGSSILKLITARIYLQLNPELQQNKVLWKYLSEYFHIENLNVFGLNPTEFELIPPHILDSIDELFN